MATLFMRGGSPQARANAQLQPHPFVCRATLLSGGNDYVTFRSEAPRTALESIGYGEGSCSATRRQLAYRLLRRSRGVAEAAKRSRQEWSAHWPLVMAAMVGFSFGSMPTF